MGEEEEREGGEREGEGGEGGGEGEGERGDGRGEGRGEKGREEREGDAEGEREKKDVHWPMSLHDHVGYLHCMNPLPRLLSCNDLPQNLHHVKKQ